MGASERSDALFSDKAGRFDVSENGTSVGTETANKPNEIPGFQPRGCGPLTYFSTRIRVVRPGKHGVACPCGYHACRSHVWFGVQQGL